MINGNEEQTWKWYPKHSYSPDKIENNCNELKGF